jgi:SepF-like predicted cell division protein (DUF552 family)
MENKKIGDDVEDIYLKALVLSELSELPKIKTDVSRKFIVILRVTPMAQRNVDELRRAIEELYEFSVSIGGDIARLGEERVVITPPGVKIWRGLA